MINHGGTFRPLLISPHLDDAVFACGEWLLDHPGTPVLTLFAGDPPADLPLTAWDRRCGFHDGRAAMAARREEDQGALALLDAVPRWLPFLDDQYGVPVMQCALTEAITAHTRATAANALVMPLGLFHADHRHAADAALQAHDHLPSLQLMAYEDVPYRAIEGLLQQRLAELRHDGWIATPLKAPTRTPDGRKAAALARYASQLRAFGDGGLDDPFRPERLWTLQRASHPAA